jgi:tRNA(Ile)-lysidine synthase
VTASELVALFQGLERSRGIVLAVSGGSDSTALMHLFVRWAHATNRFSNSLVVTVDHGLRAQAAAEARLVADQAHGLGLRHSILAWAGDKPKSDIQNAARKARYRLLADAASAEGADTILTAHTQDDQAETFLLALARGSGVYGLAGMPREREMNGVRLVRPLLQVPKARLVATLMADGIRWSEDPSNRDDRYRRVTMRLGSPALASVGLGAATLAGTAERLARAANALDAYADRLIARAVTVHEGGYLDVDMTTLSEEPEEVLLRAFARMLRAMTGATYVPRLARLERLLGELMSSAAAGQALQRTLGGVTVWLRPAKRCAPGRLWLFPEAGRAGFSTASLLPGETIDWEDRIRVTLSPTAPEAMTIRAIGPAALRLLADRAPVGVPTPALSTLASIWQSDELVAVLGVPGIGSGADRAIVTGSPLVRSRLNRAKATSDDEYEHPG